MTNRSPTAAATESSYDEVPYDSQPFAYTHPDQLSVMAVVFGLEPAPVARCRVLELGCASGGNLLPMAAGLPQSDFLGVDLSARQIEAGQAMLDQAGLDNVSLECRSIMDVDESDGQFDYIVCHGVYSWVPADVRHKILKITRNQFAPHGAAYISYNTLPGWHLRGAIREMMQFHAARFDSAGERVEQARALLDFLSASTPGMGGAYSQVLADELEIIRSRGDSYVFHEHLEEHNEPIYFHRFVEDAQTHGLRFLSEASLGEMVPNQLSDEAVDTLGNIAPDIVHMEQYMDFLRNRMFRRTLLCHGERVPERRVEPERLLDFFAAAPLAPDKAPNEQGEYCFTHPNGSSVRVGDPVQREALEILHACWPGRRSVRELAAMAADEAGTGRKPDEVLVLVAKLLLDCFAGDIVELRRDDQRFVTTPGRLPATTALARAQAVAGIAPTNLRHESVEMVDLSRRTLALLDGTRDRADLVREIVDLVMAGELSLEHAGEAVTDRERVSALAASTMDEVLDDLGRRALLTA